LYRGIYEHSPVGIAYSSESTGKIKRCNKRFCDILGYSESAVLGKTVATFTHQEDIEKDNQTQTYYFVHDPVIKVSSNTPPPEM